MCSQFQALSNRVQCPSGDAKYLTGVQREETKGKMQLQSGEKEAGLSLEVPGNFSLDKAET